MVSEASSSAGRAVRRRVPRSAHAQWSAGPERPDPVRVLERQGLPRVPHLLPLRYARMAASPVAFLRGSAALTAADLASAPHTGLRVQLCGDAHLANFGLFASREDHGLLFDVADFDETMPGPFEWDVKRLAASAATATRENGGGDAACHAAALAAVSGYRTAMRRLAARGEVDVWQARVDATQLLPLLARPRRRLRLAAGLAGARRTDLPPLAALLTSGPDGRPRLVCDPPLLTPLDHEELAGVEQTFRDYRDHLPEERRMLLDRFRLADAARATVGVGGVGVRSFVVLLLGRISGEPLLLHLREAERSALEPHLTADPHRHQGDRVVAGQQLTQSAADPFLGRATGPGGRHYYWRRLRDVRAAPDPETMPRQLLRAYARLCGQTLARAHARSGDRVAIAAYLGSGDAFDLAVADFALAYAAQARADHAALVAALGSGRLAVAAEAPVLTAAPVRVEA